METTYTKVDDVTIAEVVTKPLAIPDLLEEKRILLARIDQLTSNSQDQLAKDLKPSQDRVTEINTLLSTADSLGVLTNPDDIAALTPPVVDPTP